MPILHRVLLAFCVVIAIGGTQSALTVRNLRQLSAGLDAATSVPIAQVDAAWRAWDAFQAAGKALSEVLDGIHDQPDAAAIARFRSAAEPIDRELARALSGDAKADGAARLPGLVGQWKAAALTLLGGEPRRRSPRPTPWRSGSGTCAAPCKR